MDTQNHWITLPDGRRLAARVWLPEGANEHPVPAILEYLPYRLGDGTAMRDEGNYPAFAAAGYAGVRVDMAGNGNSDGYMWDEYVEDELAVGEEVIAWIASQKWCSGAVGMIGISWGGFNGLQIAMRRPAPLKAIVTVCSTHDRYRQETHYIGGCVLNDNFNWGAQMTAYSSRPPDPEVRADWREVWLDRLHRLPFMASNWLRQQRHGAYWKHGSVCEDWSAIECAVLAVGGWADSYSDTPAVLVEKLTAPVKALVGPWEHRYPNLAKIEPRADFQGEVIRWFDHWLKGEQNDAMDLPAYRAYLQQHGAPTPKFIPRPGCWVGETKFPSTTPPLVLHLAPGKLAMQATEKKQEEVVCSDQDIGLASGNYCPGMRVDDELPSEQSSDDAKSVCFDGEPLSKELDVLGAPVVEFEFSVNAPRAILAFRLCDVAANDSSCRVTFGVLNLCHYLSHERPVELRAGQRYRARIELRHCGHRFVAGHRLRLAVSTAYWPTVWPSPSKAAVTLHLENCRVILPMREISPADQKFTPAAPPPSASPKPAFKQLRAPSCKTSDTLGKDGIRKFVLNDDLGAYLNPHNGMESGATVQQLFAIHPNDPLQARVETTWQYTHRRGEWHTRVHSHSVMTANAYEFILTRTVSAYEKDNLCYKKSWNEAIPRDCC